MIPPGHLPKNHNAQSTPQGEHGPGLCPQDQQGHSGNTTDSPSNSVWHFMLTKTIAALQQITVHLPTYNESCQISCLRSISGILRVSNLSHAGALTC